MLTLLLALTCAPLPVKGDQHTWTLTDVRAIAWAGDNSAVIAGTATGQIVVWNARTGREMTRWKAEKDLVALSLRGDVLVSGSEGGRIEVWIWRKGELVRSFRTSDWLRSLCLHPEGRSLAVVAGGTVKCWDVLTRKEIQTIENDSPFEVPQCVSYSPDGDKLAVSGSVGRNDEYVGSWYKVLHANGRGFNYGGSCSFDGSDIQKRKNSLVSRAVWSPNSQHFVHDVGAALCLRSDRASELRQYHDVNFAGFAYSSHHETWVAARSDGRIEWADRRGWSLWNEAYKLGPIKHFALSPDGKHFAVANERKVMLRSLPKEPVR